MKKEVKSAWITGILGIVNTVLIYVSVILTIISGVDYIVKNVDVLKG